MKKTGLINVLALLFLLACGRDGGAGDQPPIPLDTLPYILSDVLLVESGVKEFPYSTRDSLAKIQYERVLRLHGFTYADLTATLQWMQEDPKRVESVYEEVMETMTARDAEGQ